MLIVIFLLCMRYRFVPEIKQVLSAYTKPCLVLRVEILQLQSENATDHVTIHQLVTFR